MCFLGGLFVQYQVLLSRDSQVVDATMEARMAENTAIVDELVAIFREAVLAQG